MKGFENGTKGKEYEFTGETQMATHKSVSSRLQIEKCNLKQDSFPCVRLENINRVKSHFAEGVGKGHSRFLTVGAYTGISKVLAISPEILLMRWLLESA